MDIQRTKVFIVGKSNLIESDYGKSFGLIYEVFDLAKGSSALDFSQGSSIIFDLSSGKLSVLLTKLSDIVIPALDHGLYVIALCKLTDIKTINYNLANTGLDNQIIVLAIENNFSLQLDKHLIQATFKQTRAFNSNCKVTISNDQLIDSNSEFLFKRAFSDFKEIHLKPLSPGFSASGVYCVHVISPILDEARITPFFAKIDTREKITKELENYKHHVLPAIPFNLRPNIDERRCIFSAKHGLLVGNFVENSNSLWHLIAHGQARSVIYSLFDQALYAWRHPLNTPSSAAPLFKIAPLNLNEIETLKKRYIKARSLDDSILAPENLHEALNNLPFANFVKIRLHGDLHTENICSRNGEAILIDFASVRYGPPSMDPTALEVWIAFRKWPQSITNFDEWRAVIDQLYSFKDHSISVPQIAHEPSPWASVWNSIRQIRSISFSHLEEDRFEYLGCLSFWLFRNAKYSNSNPSDELEDKVMGYAYYLASKITTNLKNYNIKLDYAA